MNRKVLSIVLALVMVLAFAIPVSAAPSQTIVDHQPVPVVVVLDADGNPVIIPAADQAQNDDPAAPGPHYGFSFLVQDCKGNLVPGAEFTVYEGSVASGNVLDTIYSDVKPLGGFYDYEWGDDVWHWGNPAYGWAMYSQDEPLKPNTVYTVEFTKNFNEDEWNDLGYTNSITKFLTFETDELGRVIPEDQNQVYTIGCPACEFQVQFVGDNFIGVPNVQYEVFNLKIDEQGNYRLTPNENGPGQYQQRTDDRFPNANIYGDQPFTTTGTTDSNGFASIAVEVDGFSTVTINGQEVTVQNVTVNGEELGYGEFFGIRQVGSNKVWVVNPWKIDDTVRGEDRVAKVDPTIIYYFDNEVCQTVTIPVAKATATIRVNVVANGNPDDPSSVNRVPVVGAEVGLFENITEIWGRVTKGDQIDKQTTDVHGFAYFKNVDLSEAFEYLSPFGPYWFPGETADWEMDDASVVLPYLVQQLSAPAGFYVNDNLFQVYVTEGDLGKYIDVVINTGTYTNAIGRISGENRFETAVEVADATYPEGLTEWDGHKTVIIANGYNFPDALAGGVLTEAYEAPLLLTNADHLNAFTKEYIEDNGATRAIILGGTNSVNVSVANELSEMGLAVKRLQGDTRYDTAVAIGDDLIKLLNDNSEVKFRIGYKYDGTVFLANGEDFADALTASVPAADFGTPLLLARNGNSLTDATADALDRWNIRNVVIVGGPNSVSDSLKTSLENDGYNVVRYYGENRATTAMAISKEYYNQTTKAFIASAYEFTDALVGARLAAQQEAPILLVNKDSVPAGVAEYIRNNNISTLTILGGPNTVSDAVAAELANVILGN